MLFCRLFVEKKGKITSSISPYLKILCSLKIIVEFIKLDLGGQVLLNVGIY